MQYLESSGVSAVPIDFAGKTLRKLDTIIGKGFIANRILAPLVKGRGIESVVEMSNPGGGKLICNLDDWIPWNVYLYGRYRVEERYEQFMLYKARGCDVILDVGANIGYYTVQFSRIGSGSVHAFEPMSYQFGVLQRNVELNQLENVVTQQSIVSDSMDVKRVYFYAPDNTGKSSLESPTENYEDVKTISIDLYADEHVIKQIDLIKIDVEGHELKVLKGMSKLLAEKKVLNLFVEMNQLTLEKANTSKSEILSYLQSFGYCGYSIKTGNKKEYTGQDESLVYFKPL